jgi:polysaccharide biosynthesis transport protein
MSDDKLTHRPSEEPLGLEGYQAAGQPAAYAPGSYLAPHADEEEEGGVDVRRYLHALLRRKWWIAAAGVVGLAGGVLAWRSVDVSYTAEGSLWLEAQPREDGADVSPIRTSGLLQSSGWIELMRSYAVLDSVVVDERLYLEAPEEHAEAFESLVIDNSFVPGPYRLEVAGDGRSYVLATAGGAIVERGELGGRIGVEIGLEWAPPAASFPPSTTVEFQILHPRDAARELSQQLVTRIDQQGNFIRLSLDGREPERIASTLNALMDRHVALAAILKRSRLDETVGILGEQLQYTEAELAQAEQDLEEFRVTTITLPSDQATPIAPGLEQTRDPVFTNYFNMQVDLETVRRDRERLEQVVEGFQSEGVHIEALEAIPSAMTSSELNALLTALVAARSELRVLRERYSDDFTPVRELIQEIRTIETESIPNIVRGIVLQLAVRESQMQALVDSASAELAAIPPRTIEEGRLRRRVQSTENLYNDLRVRVETARLASASSIPDVRILDRAAVPQVPTNDRRVQLAGLIFLACVGSAVGGVLMLDRMDARFRYAGDVTREFGLDILGSIPRIQMDGKRKGALNTAQALEAFRELRIHVGFAYGSAGPITIAISSPSAGEGKSLISSNLAVAFAEIGRRTLLLDADTRRGDAHRLLGRERVPGLVDYLRDRSGHDIIQKTDIENLDFIGSGSRGSSTPELLASTRLAHFIGALKRSYDVIIVDCPPLAAGGDALILSSLVGNMALVLRTGTTDKHLTHAKLDRLQRLPIRLLGAILNDVDPSGGYDSYYYSTYLPDYQPIPEEQDEDGVKLLSREQNG